MRDYTAAPPDKQNLELTTSGRLLSHAVPRPLTARITSSNAAACCPLDWLTQQPCIVDEAEIDRSARQMSLIASNHVSLTGCCWCWQCASVRASVRQALFDSTAAAAAAAASLLSRAPVASCANPSLVITSSCDNDEATFPGSGHTCKLYCYHNS